MCIKEGPFTPTMSERERLEEALNRDSVARHEWCADGKIIIAAARKYLETLPKTKMVEVWRVEYAHRGQARAEVYESQGMALSRKEELESNRDGSRELPAFACIRIVGPYEQKVPA